MMGSMLLLYDPMIKKLVDTVHIHACDSSSMRTLEFTMVQILFTHTVPE